MTSIFGNLFLCASDAEHFKLKVESTGQFTMLCTGFSIFVLTKARPLKDAVCRFVCNTTQETTNAKSLCGK
eukprot:4747460-Amphidinium_carterae.1